MLKRIGLALMVAAVLLSGGMITAQDATPDIEGPVLAIYLTDVSHEARESAVEGDLCFLSSWSPPNMGWTRLDHQIVVRNGANEIIAIHTANPTYKANGTKLFCNDVSVIPLPVESFYQVFLNDQWIAGYTPESLPSDPDYGLYIDVSRAPWD